MIAITKRDKDARLMVLHNLAQTYLWMKKCADEWETTCSLSGADTGEAIEDLNASMEIIERLMDQLKCELHPELGSSFPRPATD